MTRQRLATATWLRAAAATHRVKHAAARPCRMAANLWQRSAASKMRQQHATALLNLVRWQCTTTMVLWQCAAAAYTISTAAAGYRYSSAVVPHWRAMRTVETCRRSSRPVPTHSCQITAARVIPLSGHSSARAGKLFTAEIR